jgi:hypothetical protein
MDHQKSESLVFRDLSGPVLPEGKIALQCIPNGRVIMGKKNAMLHGCPNDTRLSDREEEVYFYM